MKRFVLFVVFGFVFYSLIATYSLMTRPIVGVAVCGAGEGGLYVPESFCDFVLLKMRLSSSSVSEIESGGGLATLYEIESEFVKYRYLDAYIQSGVSVNAESVVTGLPPLHAAVLLNDSKLVVFLVSRKANPKQLSSGLGLNALDFLYYLERKGLSVDRSGVESVLVEGF